MWLLLLFMINTTDPGINLLPNRGKLFTSQYACEESIKKDVKPGETAYYSCVPLKSITNINGTFDTHNNTSNNGNLIWNGH